LTCPGGNLPNVDVCPTGNNDLYYLFFLLFLIPAVMVVAGIIGVAVYLIATRSATAAPIKPVYNLQDLGI